jgi:copper oxidase (laccase) domain-containing protein
VAFVGPASSAEGYQVGPEVAAEFEQYPDAVVPPTEEIDPDSVLRATIAVAQLCAAVVSTTTP